MVLLHLRKNWLGNSCKYPWKNYWIRSCTWNKFMLKHERGKENTISLMFFLACHRETKQIVSIQICMVIQKLLWYPTKISLIPTKIHHLPTKNIPSPHKNCIEMTKVWRMSHIFASTTWIRPCRLLPCQMHLTNGEEIKVGAYILSGVILPIHIGGNSENVAIVKGKQVFFLFSHFLNSILRKNCLHKYHK